MSPAVGEYALVAALVSAVAVIFAVLYCWMHEEDGALQVVRWGTVAIAVFLTVSSLTLVLALVGDNFALRYVTEHSSRSLALGYKLSAFWASQGGGMLFWAWAMSLMAVVMAWRTWKRTDLETGVSLAVMALIVGFFAAVILFAGSDKSPSNPFETLATTPRDGQGLNAKLQNVAMAAHPPMLFLGYAGYAAPFALLIGALMAGKGDGRWLKDARLWSIWAWTTLTVGIVLGCWWAYVDLSFGGYWKWDPVENASLVPWLAGTAFLHAAVVSAKRGMLKGWTAATAVLSFVMCIFGTYITRSGIDSSHSFASSDIPYFFLALMILVITVSVVLLIARRKLLASERPFEEPISREGFILAANVLLIAMTLMTVAGTSAPLVMKLMGKQQGMVQPPFYNMAVLPMAMVLGALMATGPVLGFGMGAAGRSKKQLRVLVIAGVVAGVITAMLGARSPWAVAAAAVVAAVIAGVVQDFAAAWTARQTGTGESIAGAGLRVVSGGIRHWGAQVAHLGLAATIVGVVGSSVYNATGEFGRLRLGESRQVGDVTLTFRKVEDLHTATYAGVQAVLDVKTGAGEQFVLRPELRAYHTQPQQPVSPVDLRVRLSRDIYTALNGIEEGPDGVKIGLLVVLNPLVNWIWIGGALLMIGGAMCLIPARQPAAVAVTAPEKARKSRTPLPKPI